MPPINESPSQRASARPARLAVTGILLATTLASLWPVFHRGLFVSDEELHWLRRLSEFDFAIRQGQWWPRWFPNLEWGHGYPFPNFYAPGALWLSWLFYLPTHSYLWGVKGAFIVAAWLAPWGMYRCLRPRVSRPAAVCGALLYLLAPYHTLNIYVRGNLPEYLAMGLFPWAMWGLDRLRRKPDIRSFTLAAILVAAFQFTHALSAFFGSAILGLLILIESTLDRDPRAAARRLGAMAAGVAITTAYWLPALHDAQFVQLSKLGDQIVAADHVVYPWQFVEPWWGWEYSVPGPGDTISFQVGLPHLAGLLLALFLARRLGATILPWLTLCLVLLLVITPLFGWFWQLPVLKMIQFPWRLLAWVAVGTSVCGALAINKLDIFHRPAAPAIVIVFILTQLAFCRAEFWREVRELEFWPEATARFFPGNTGEDDYLPIWVTSRPSEASDRMLRGLTIPSVSARTVGPFFHQTAEVMLPTEDALVWDVYYYPTWQAMIDGSPTLTRPRPDGKIAVIVPAGRHQVTLEWERTPVHTIAAMVSCLTLLSLLYAALRFAPPSAKIKSDRQTGAPA